MKPTIQTRSRFTRTYLIQGETTRLIKIGKTLGNVSERLAQLQAASPDVLRIIGIIHGDMERRLHATFAVHRAHGEWFHPHPDVLKFLESATRLTKQKNLSSRRVITALESTTSGIGHIT